MQLKVDSKNDALVRNLSNDALINVFSDLRYAKGMGDISMYHHMLAKNGFIVFDPRVQIERICHYHQNGNGMQNAVVELTKASPKII